MTKESKDWKEGLRIMRKEGWSWNDLDDIDSFAKGELEDFIEGLLQEAIKEAHTKGYTSGRSIGEVTTGDEDYLQGQQLLELLKKYGIEDES
jgi:hypothetical protein